MVLLRGMKSSGTAVVLPVTALGLWAALPPTPVQAAAPGADLRILSPRAGDSLGSQTFDLDVSYQSRSRAPIVTAELWVDGVRWVRRDLEKQNTKGVLTFAFNGADLSEGSHTIVVKVFGADGGASTKSITITAGNKSGVTENTRFGAPEMVFTTPINGKRVSGTVDLELDAPDRDGENPYVTFLIDKKFKTLKNYAPYTYSWDTSDVPNGYHTIEAIGYFKSSNLSTTRKLRVYVDNAGGNTNRMNTIPDLAAPTAHGAAPAVKPLAIPLPPRTAPAALAEAPRFAAPVLPVVAAAPSAVGIRDDAAAAVPSTAASAVVDVRLMVPSGTTAVVAAPAAAPTAFSGARASGETGKLAPPRPRAAVAPPKNALAAAPARRMAPPSVGLVSAGPVSVASAAKPAGRVIAPVKRITPAPAPAMRTTVAGLTPAPSKAAPRAGVKRIIEPILQKADGIQVAFDGERIAFDVAPRVEAGLSLAPFRQIFEHTGGRVQWVGGTRTVRAVSADREVVINMGEKTARVNGAKMTLARPAFLEQGRTVVPLSFVAQALDVDVKYDAATGRLQITSK